MAENNHATLLEAISRGDESSLKALYELFKLQVYNTALSYLQNQAEAEEVCQDVFVKVFRSAGSFKGKSSVSTWIYRITINQSLDRLNYNKRQKRFGFIQRILDGDAMDMGAQLPDFEHPGVLLEHKEDSKILFAAIKSLPDQQKTAFILSFVEERPRQEVADIMELSLKATESLIQRAKANLRIRLEEFHPNRRK